MPGTASTFGIRSKLTVLHHEILSHSTQDLSSSSEYELLRWLGSVGILNSVGIMRVEGSAFSVSQAVPLVQRASSHRRRRRRGTGEVGVVFVVGARDGGGGVWRCW